MSTWKFAKLSLYIALASSAAMLPTTAFAVAHVLHRYTFNDGTVNDSVGTAHGTLFVPTNPTFAPTYNAGRLDLRANNGAGPNGTITATNGSFVELPDGLFTDSVIAGTNGSITLEAWVNVATNRNNSRFWSFGSSLPDGTNPYWGANTDWVDLNAQNGGTQLALTTHDFSQVFNTNELMRAPLTPGQTFHVLATLDKNDTSAGATGTMKLYVNNVEVVPPGPPSTSTRAISAGLDIANFLNDNNYLGRSQWSDPLFDGQIDEFAIYDAAMTPTEVAARFAAGPVPTPIPTFVINRGNGDISVKNLTPINFNLKSYSISSAQGTLDPVAWQSITDTGGFGAGWSEQSATSTQLAESATSTGGQLAANTGTRSLGLNAWRRTPFQDLTATFVLGDGSTGTADISYTGNAIPSGDLNGDGAINVADWSIFLAGSDVNYMGQTRVQSYLGGDLNGDFVNDVRDFRLFRAAFIANNGAGAFAALLGGNIPEPAALALAAMGLIGLAFGRRTRKPMLVVLCVLYAGSIGGQVATAATPVSYVGFGDPGLAPDANGGIDDVWTTTLSVDGGRGSGFFGFPPAIPDPHWAMYSYPIAAINGSIQADHTFAGGALSVGQAVRIDFANRGVAALGSVGVSLTSGGTPVATMKFNGQDPLGVYRYDDAGGTDQTTPEPFAFERLATLEFRIDSGNKYVAAYGSSSWSGTTAAGLIDGIRVFNNAGGDASDVSFENLQIGATTLIPLSLEVNKSNNDVKIKGNPSLIANIDYYQITSVANGLNTVLWNSLDQQNYGAVDGPGDADSIPGNSLAEGWDKVPSSNPGRLKEYFVRDGGSVVPSGGVLPLGKAYNQSTFGSADGDLVFQYGLLNGVTLSGTVSYVGGIGVVGDFDASGAVANGDLTLLLDNWGHTVPPVPAGWIGFQPTAPAVGNDELTALLDHWGQTGGGGSLAIGVPEPTSLVLFGITGLVALAARRRYTDLTSCPRNRAEGVGDG